MRTFVTGTASFIGSTLVDPSLDVGEGVLRTVASLRGMLDLSLAG
jgi:hypothetical protein